MNFIRSTLCFTSSATTTEGSSAPARKKSDGNDYDESFTLISHDEANLTAPSGWTQLADRQLYVLHFFTAHSFATLASLLNFSAPWEVSQWLYGSDVRVRLSQLSSAASNDPHAFIFHEIKRLAARTESIVSNPQLVQLDAHFAESWRFMQTHLEVARRDGLMKKWTFTDGRAKKQGVGYDLLSEQELRMAGVPWRRWGPEARERLRGRAWTGLRVLQKRERSEAVGE